MTHFTRPHPRAFAWRWALGAAVLAAAGAAAAAPASWTDVTSPDGRIVMRVRDDGRRFTVARDGETAIDDSPLGIEVEGDPALDRLALTDRSDVTVDRTIPLIATKAASARDHYHGATLVFRETGGTGRRLSIDVRAYDDGVAFRYRLDGPAPVRVVSERTGFVPAGDPACLSTEMQGAHETQFDRRPVSAMKADVAYDVPVVCPTPSGRTHYALLQAHLQGYAGASLWREGRLLRVRLSAVPDRPGPPVRSANGLVTAWRVVMMGDREGDLMASTLIGNLNPRPHGDFSWVRPGKAAWDWWSGPLRGMTPSMASYRRFIDFAAASGFRYYLIDAGWAKGSPAACWVASPATDITRAAPGIDMPALVRYAASKGVGLLLWTHWVNLAAHMTQALDTYQRWGIRGVKVDFMARDDQEMVDFYGRIAAETAKRHLLLDLHAAYLPDGLERTYPNFITQEGVLGAEWNKMNRNVTPRHNLMLPYTRMLAGPMDYTPGGFHNATPATFQVRELLPMTQTTRGQALAMYVVYDSPLQMVADDPDTYRGAAGFGFIRRVPTAWDETRFVAGEPGRDVVLARRRGRTWYLGAMTADAARTESVPLGFLGRGRYRATLWEDGASPNELRRLQRIVTAADTLDLPLAADGGAAVAFDPLPPAPHGPAASR